MKLYVAGASAEIKRCEAFRDAAVALGCTLSADWMAMVREVGNANHLCTDDERREAKQLAGEGVRRCDMFVLLMPRAGMATIGAWYELGLAENCMCDVLLVGDAPERTVMSHGLDHISSDDEALGHLRRMMEREAPAREGAAL